MATIETIPANIVPDSTDVSSSSGNHKHGSASVDRKRTIADNDSLTEATPPKSAPKFTVTYSRLCDGGTQEMSAAVACVRDIFPDAAIQTTRRQPREDLGVSNPSVVISTSSVTYGRRRSSASSSTISTIASDVLWEAKQKNLYEKYPKKRRRSVKDMRKSLEAFRELLGADDDDDDDDAPEATPPRSIGGSCGGSGADKPLGPPHS